LRETFPESIAAFSVFDMAPGRRLISHARALAICAELQLSWSGLQQEKRTTETVPLRVGLVRKGGNRDLMRTTAHHHRSRSFDGDVTWRQRP
jgi:hypothetical protein